MSYSDDDLHKLLQASGERWRATLPEVDRFSVATLVRRREQGRSLSLPLGMASPLAMVLIATVVLLAMFVAGPLGSPTQTIPPPLQSASPSTVGWPSLLYLENRGGPAYTVAINGINVVTVACDAYLTLSPGTDSIPQLPWDVTFTRDRDSSVLAAQHVTALPRWFVQIGYSPLGLSDRVVLGPMGPTCPPDPPMPSSLPPCSTDQEASRLAVIEAVNLDTLNFGGVYLDDKYVLVIQYVGANAGRPAVEQKLTCGVAVRWEKVDRSRVYLDGIQSEILSRVQRGEEELRFVFAIALDTIGNQVEVLVGPGGSASEVSQFLVAEYGDAVHVEFSSDIPVIQPGVPSPSP